MTCKSTVPNTPLNRVRYFLVTVGLFVGACVTALAQDVNWSIDQYSVLGSDDTQFSTQAGPDGKPLSGSNFNVTNPFADEYDIDLYERPVTSSIDEYYNYVDIKTTYVGLDDDFFYYAIEVVGTNSSGDLEGQYGFEVDFDGDDRGDFHFQVLDAKSSEIQSVSWTNKTLEAWEDVNETIGGANPRAGNDPCPNQDGFETEREKEGSNVFARIARTSGGAAIPNIIEIAVRQSFVGNPATAGSLRGWATKGGQSL